MSTDPEASQSEPVSPDESLPPSTTGDDAWLGDLLLAFDAAKAAGLMTPSPGSSPDKCEGDLAARLALARACLARLHRRWPWPGGSANGASPFGPLAELGLTLGRYTLVNLIGSGGHGLVFLANDLTLQRKVALKIPRPEWLAAERHRKRFLREAHALARLDHPGIVPIYDFGESGSICYLATAYVDGPSLADWLARQPERPSPESAARLALQLAEAVAHAHSRGVLHRDLKPSNILVEPAIGPDATPILRISDFGLAKLLDESREDRTETLPFGTPRYMAPEQAAGDRERIGPATDVYGLGAILHAILTGAGPDGPADAGGTGLAARPDLPDSLSRVMARCLQRKPEDRYPTAEALAGDLRRFLAGEPVRARPRGRWQAVASSVKRHPAAVVALALVGMLIALFAASRRTDQSRLEAAGRLSGRDALAKVREAEAERHRNYVKGIQRAFHLIHENHDCRSAEADQLDPWSGSPEPGRVDERGFEWGYLKNLGHREWLTLRHRQPGDGGRGAVHDARFSADGRRLLSAGADGTARIWDVATGRLIKALDHHGTEVNAAVFSPDESRVATGSDDGLVRLWDAASGVVIREFTPAHTDEVSCLAFTPDGRRLISGGKDRRLAVWDVATGHALVRDDPHADWILSLAMARDGKFAVVGTGNPRRFALLELKEPYPLRWFSHSSTGARAVDLAPDGRTIAAAWHTDVLLLDREGGLRERRLSDHRDGVYSLSFAPDGSLLASVGGEGDPAIRIWDMPSGQLRDLLPGHTNRVWSISVSSDGQRLATASDDGTIKVWELARRPDRTVAAVDVAQYPAGVEVRFEKNSDDHSNQANATLMAITQGGLSLELDADTGKRAKSARILPGPISAARLSPDGRTIAAFLPDGSLMIVDLVGRRAPIKVAMRPGLRSAEHLSFDQTGERLAVFDHGTDDILVIATATGLLSHRLPRRSAPFTPSPLGYAFLRDGRRLLFHEMDNRRTAVWELAEGSLRTDPAPIASGGILVLAVSPDGNLLATGDRGRSVQIRDAATLEVRSTLVGHRGPVSALAFAPDGRRLASGDQFGAVKLWDLTTGEELLELEGMVDCVHLLQFAPDGETLVAGSRDHGGHFVVWHGRPHQSEGPDNGRSGTADISH
jgi:WD40 repeat protein/tRNA A-37 threonylcarbamoyl transferase component Bud32